MISIGLNAISNELEKVNKHMQMQISLQAQMLTKMNKTAQVTKKAAKETAKAAKEIYSLEKAASVTRDANQGLAASFGDLAKDSKKWTIASRILSGSGLWKLQNYVRATGEAINVYRESNEKAIEATNKSMKAVGNISEEYNKLEGELNKLKSAQKDLSNFDELLKNNEELKTQYEAATLVFGKGEEAKQMALSRTTQQYEVQQKKMLKVRNKLKAGMDKLLKSEKANELKTIKKNNKETVKEFMKMRKTQAKLTAKKRKLESGGLFGRKGTAEQQMAAGEAMRSHRGQMGQFGKQAGLGAGILPAIAEQAEGRKELIKKVVGYATLFTPIKKATVGLFKAARHPFKTVGKIYRGFKTSIGSVGKLAKMGLSYAMYFVLLMVGAFIIFEVIKKIFDEAGVMKILMETFQGIFEGISDVVSGIMTIFGAFFGEGTFGERFEMLLAGLWQIFGGLLGILQSALKGVLDIAWQLVVGYAKFVLKFFTTYLWQALGWLGKKAVELILKIPSFLLGIGKWIFGALPEVVQTIFDWGKEFFTTKVTDIWNLIKNWTIVQKIQDAVSAIKNLWNTLKENVFNPMGEAIANAWGWMSDTFSPMFTTVKGYIDDIIGIIQDILDSFDFFAAGGVTENSLNIVGERGPELIHTPKGTRVYSNKDTKKLLGDGGKITATAQGVTNNIHVNVNGRIGASDTELRDIAKKIGRMVSSEINRTTSSSTNVRF